MKKTTDNSRCIREYTRRDGATSYHAEVRRINAKPLRRSFRTITAPKNWVRATKSAILDGRYLPDNKARKHTLDDLINQYRRLHLSKFPRRLKDQTPHLRWWKEQYGEKALVEITPSLIANAKEMLLRGVTIRNIAFGKGLECSPKDLMPDD